MSNQILQNKIEESEIKTYTTNGAEAYSTTLDLVLDFFFKAGALRNVDENSIIQIFSLAFNENPLKALKILFWARDVRGGAGERRLFRIIVKFLGDNYPEILSKNLHLFSKYGRWDDLFCLIDTKVQDDVLKLISEGLKNNDGLLAKWLPRKGNLAKIFRQSLKLTPKEYRKTLVNLSNTVEQLMCSNQWNNIDYQKVPSIAISKYSAAFLRHSAEKYNEFLTLVEKGEAKINASSIMPHDIIKSLKRDPVTANTQWKALPDYIGDSKENFICVCDVSGSMDGLPLDVCVALGIYLSEKNNGIFKNAFITFSSTPQLQYLTGTNLLEKVTQLENAEWETGTNLQAVFDLVLNTAVKNNVPESDMPTTILIKSDMQFDSCVTGGTGLDMIRKKYSDNGYNMPNVIFWNLDAKSNVPAKFNEEKIALVSGFSPAIMKSILGGDITPINVLNRTIESERYKDITI